jgi:hypothetical protein
VTSRYWVGASDLGHEGTWLWVDNTTVDTKLYFHPGEPNDAGFVNYNIITIIDICDGGSTQVPEIIMQA